MGGRGLGLWGRRIQAMWAWPRAVNQTGSVPRIYFYCYGFLLVCFSNFVPKTQEIFEIFDL